MSGWLAVILALEIAVVGASYRLATKVLDERVAARMRSRPVLGRLDPPHRPGDAGPRLEISFAVDAERWLRATVEDLRTGRRLMDGQQVVRLA